TRRTAARGLDVYREMVRANPSTFGYFWTNGVLSLCGCSPLKYLGYAHGSVQLETDAGTRPLTGDAGTDARAAADLASNAKDTAEHDLVVAAELQALNAIAQNQSVTKVVDREIRKFSHVMHLYTVLEARVRHPLTIADVVSEMFPPAAVSGSPKLAAL